MFERLFESVSTYGFVVGRTPEFPDILHSSYPQEWLTRYFECGLYRRDPIFQSGVSCVRRKLSAAVVDVRDHAEFYSEAGEFGIKSDTVIANCIGGNKFLLGSVVEAAEIEGLIGIVRVDHMRYMLEKVDGLTDRQKEVLDLFDWGMRTKQAALELGISTGAIDQHKRRIVDALGVTNFSSAASVYSVYKWSGILSN